MYLRKYNKYKKRYLDLKNNQLLGGNSCSCKAQSNPPSLEGKKNITDKEKYDQLVYETKKKLDDLKLKLALLKRVNDEKFNQLTLEEKNIELAQTKIQFAIDAHCLIKVKENNEKFIYGLYYDSSNPIEQCSFEFFKDNPHILLIFNDNTSGDGRGGNAIARYYTNSLGIPTGPGFSSLDKKINGKTARVYIDEAIQKIRNKIQLKNYTYIIYSIKDLNDDTLGTDIFSGTIGQDVVNYITEQIYGLI